MTKTLVIAEKPSVAGDIAKALGKFERHGTDFYENDQYVISSAVGHLLELAPPDGFEAARGKWKMENLPSLPEDFALVPIEKNAGRLATLKKLLKRKEVGAVTDPRLPTAKFQSSRFFRIRGPSGGAEDWIST